MKVTTIPLWHMSLPPNPAPALAETVNARGLIENVSEPSISVYLPQQPQHHGTALLIFAGGGYTVLDWKTHVVYAAEVFNPKGIAVIGLKYRTRPPYLGTNEAIQAITLQDAKRALRLVRHNAKEWGIDPARIGVVGYSAGANLALNLAANFDIGDDLANDPVARESSRPDFAIGLATWHWQRKESPFNFKPDTPPVLLVHAIDDTVAPIELPRAIETDLNTLNIPVKMITFPEGGHGVCDLLPERVKNNASAAQWPELFLGWLQTLTLQR